jgi:hypothetical protein
MLVTLFSKSNSSFSHAYLALLLLQVMLTTSKKSKVLIRLVDTVVEILLVKLFVFVIDFFKLHVIVNDLSVNKQQIS